MSNFEQQKTKFRTQEGFIAALDESGGSTPKALKLYGIPETAYSGDAQMMDLIHAMRTRIITSPSFNGDRVLAAILFENTMDREILGRPTADYLWDVKKVVPILKVDKGLQDEADGVQLMKPMPGLDQLLARAKAKGIFGTKMRSVIKQANAAGIKAVVAQQFEVARQIIAAGLVPIIEPEVDIHSPEKEQAEVLEADRPAPAITDYAHKNGMEMIVIATHGYTGLKKLMLGSVTLSVLNQSSGPVLVIRPEACRA